MWCIATRTTSPPNGRTRLAPVFKPARPPEMLLGYHYTGRLTLARRDLVAVVCGLDLTLEEAAESLDLMLRLSVRTDRIARITRCLYHNVTAIDVREAGTWGSAPPGRRRGSPAPHRNGGCIRDRTAQRLVPGLMAAPPHAAGKYHHPDGQ